jgi:hypothetical protein
LRTGARVIEGVEIMLRNPIRSLATVAFAAWLFLIFMLDGILLGGPLALKVMERVPPQSRTVYDIIKPFFTAKYLE